MPERGALSPGTILGKGIARVMMHALCSAVRNAMFVPWISSSSSRLSQILFSCFHFLSAMFGFLFGFFLLASISFGKGGAGAG
jgi:hypothetical protein